MHVVHMVMSDVRKVREVRKVQRNHDPRGDGSAYQGEFRQFFCLENVSNVK